MSWSTDNGTLYFADGHTKNITKCLYNTEKFDVSDCETVIDVTEEISATAVPHGLATDENNHIWVTVADEKEGAVIEVDPETNKIISKISKYLY